MSTVSVFDLFSIGIGPSSSHTVGPMRAGFRFVEQLLKDNTLKNVARVQASLYGSLALTGKGHGTDLAVLLGLSGFLPEQVDPDQVPQQLGVIRTGKRLLLAKKHPVTFEEETDLLFHYKDVLPHHANGLRFDAFDLQGNLLLQREYYSVGGGFIMEAPEFAEVKDEALHQTQKVPYPFETASQLLEHCQQQQLSIAQVMLENEKTFRSEQVIRDGLLKIWHVMDACIERGSRHSGILPGGLKVKRRAPPLLEKLEQQNNVDEMNWLNLFALSVNEENAAGGRVVTAPTNGAAGIIPAVLKYFMKFHHGNDDDVVSFLLTTGAIGILFKLGASISAAEVGCQGEVGVACSMAAAGLCAVLGGTVAQVENAAEIGMEHHLGLTCDPIGGLVQIPCIERNTMGSVQAVNSAKLALMGDGQHLVSLDDVIATMRQTGRDMSTNYKETALGGLAQFAGISVNQPAC